MSFNRYRITTNSFEKTKQFLEGKLLKSKAPKYAQSFANDLSFKGKDLFYKGLRVIPLERLDETFRSAVYGKNSKVPLNRDQGYKAITKQFAGTPRRAWAKFLLKQKELRAFFLYAPWRRPCCLRCLRFAAKMKRTPRAWQQEF